MVKTQELIPFTFQVSSNKKPIIPIHLFETCFQTNSCAAVDCYLAYPKQRFQKVAEFSAEKLVEHSKDGYLELNFTCTLEPSNHIMIMKLKAHDRGKRVLLEQMWKGKLDSQQAVQSLINELARSRELSLLLSQTRT